MQTKSIRQMTSQRVANTLNEAHVPSLGATKLNKIGRGVPYIREDGTAIKIYNLQSFRSKDDKQAAKDAWLKGHKLEKAGDINGAQEHFKAAMNKLMSFSVRLENAPDFDNSYQITAIVELVPSREDETKLVLGVNQPRPVAVGENFISDSISFEEPVEETPATTPAKKGAKKSA
jgi:hypothetical protein